MTTMDIISPMRWLVAVTALRLRASSVPAE
jgi:hypothetical protein